MASLDERYRRKQFVWNPEKRKFIEHEEVVPDYCLSADLSDHLLQIAEGTKPPDCDSHHIVMGFLLLLLIPPCCLMVYALPPLGNPADGLSVNLALTFVLADLIAGAGLCEIILQAMHVKVGAFHRSSIKGVFLIRRFAPCFTRSE